MTLANKDLRKRAEKKVTEGDVPLKAMSTGEMSRLIEELQIHQVELELQNEELRKSQAETERARKTYQDIWDFSPIGYVIMDDSGWIKDVNVSAQKLLAKPKNALLKERFTALLASDDQVAVHFLLERAATEEISATHEVRLLRENGSACTCKLFCQAFEEESGGQHLQVALTDITEQKEAVSELQKVREALQSERTKLEFPVQERTVALENQTILQREINRLLLEEVERRKQKEAVSELQKVREAVQAERTKREFPVQERTVALENHAILQRGINILLLEEVERRKQYEAELKDQGEKLIREIRRRVFLSKKLVTLLERERMEISGALHDEIGQVLTTIQMDLDVLKKMGLEDKARLKTEIEKLQKTIRSAMGLVRKIGHRIRPDILEHLGLVPAIESMIQMVKDRSNIAVHFFTKGVAKNMEENKSLAVYRIIQESLTNALKYSDAKNIFINLIQKDRTLRLNVEDDGIGFNPDELFESDGNLAALGITIMQERAALVGGELHLESQVGKGTQVLADIPVGGL